MPIEIGEFLDLEIPAFLDVLSAMRTKLSVFRLGVRPLADKNIEDVTEAELYTIPAHLRKVRELNEVITILEDVTAFKKSQMSKDQARIADSILEEIVLEADRLDLVASNFRVWARDLDCL